MKRAEFIQYWTAKRKAFFDKEEKAGRMGAAEVVMSIADLPKESANKWRRWGPTIKTMSIDEFEKL